MNAPWQTNVPAVERCQEFQRVNLLERRTDYETAFSSRFWASAEDTPTLLPIQRHALGEAEAAQGFIGFITVGEGKTLISLLLATVFDAQRPLIIVPGALKLKTMKEAEQYRFNGWHIPKFHLITYSALSQSNTSDFLHKLKPDAIIADEAHKLKHHTSACTRRLTRYMKERPDTRFAAMSGTLTTRSLKEYGHLSAFALKLGSPLPLSTSVLNDWASVVDEQNAMFTRSRPGPLLELCNNDERARATRGTPTERITAIRSAIGRRVRNTFGVVANDISSVAAELEISIVESSPQEKAVKDALERLESAWELPDGTELEDGPAVWRARRQLALGFYYRWVEKPSEEWLVARSDFIHLVRKKTRKGVLDTAKQVMSEYASHPSALSWRYWKKRFKPKTEAIWIDDTAIEYARKWRVSKKGIVWTEHVAFGEKLGVLYGPEGKTEWGHQIDDCTGEMGICASIQACGVGWNLQQFSQNLIMGCPQQGEVLEQLIGRTHRKGQTSRVCVELYFSDPCHDKALRQCLADARCIQEKYGQTQKILLDSRIKEALKSRKKTRS